MRKDPPALRHRLCFAVVLKPKSLYQAAGFAGIRSVAAVRSGQILKKPDPAAFSAVHRFRFILIQVIFFHIFVVFFHIFVVTADSARLSANRFVRSSPLLSLRANTKLACESKNVPNASIHPKRFPT